jgi:eukaryotic-like serine/threonine-protein kinase
MPIEPSPSAQPTDGSDVLDSADSFLRDAAAISDVGAGQAILLASLKEGDLLADRFVIERLAGRGGMGAVYRAVDRLSGSPVALKVMTARGQHEQRFAQEARVLSELNHPAIVRYVAHGETGDGHPYLAMEWLAGEDLAQRLARSRLGVGESLEVARRVAEALAAAHQRGVVHRDVKPSNVLLVDGQPARAKLLDFGIVRMAISGAAPTAMPMTRTGAVMGTVGYMSPEQAIGDKNLDARTDVFALGCLLFECLTGEPVFSGDHFVAVLAKVLREEAPRLRSLRPELPDALDALVARMLSKDRSSRPEHGAAVLSELVALGSIAGGAPEAGLRPAAGLSISEQRMTSVILALVPDEGVSEVVRGHGLDLARLANGALLVTLGARAAASEQVMIAAACALDILDVQPSARIALATGRALTTAGGPPGPVIDQVASLLVHSVSPGIRLDEVTAGLLGERFQVRENAQGRTLVGKRGEAESARTLLGKATPFVGRDKEVTLLEGTLRECIDESVARAVLVTGPAGQGKSRLRQEFTAKARARGDVRVLVARADPVGAGSAFVMVRQLVRHAVGVREGDPATEQNARLRAHVDAVCQAADRSRVVDFLSELLSVPSIEHLSLQMRAARNDPQLMALWLRRSFGDWMAAEIERQPLLLVLEDLHWGDVPSVTYVGDALRSLSRKPLMVLAVARPEVRDAFPDLWPEAEKAEIPVGRLVPGAVERLVRFALGDGFPSEAAARIAERADGNALFLEELIRNAAEGGAERLPETVLALVESRLDRLDPEARRVVRAASVFGETFWRGGVAALLGKEGRAIDEWLDLLQRREIFSPSRDSRFAGEREARFRHGLLRDAAYRMLTEADRVTGHKLAGEWLEGIGEKQALVLADHFERGGEPKRAVRWIAQAAQAACDGGNTEASITLGHRGLEYNPEDRDRATLYRAIGLGLAYRGDWPATIDWGHKTIALQPPGSAKWFEAVGSLLVSGVFLGDIGVTAPLIQAILGVTVEPEPTGPYGLAVSSTCLSLLVVGQPEFACSLLERAEALEKRTLEPDPQFVMWLRVARGHYEVHHVQDGARALVSLSEARDLAQSTGSALGRAMAIQHSIWALALLGACEQAEAAERDLAATGLAVCIDWGAQFLAGAWVGTGRLQDAIDRSRALLDRRDQFLVRCARANLAAALSRSGDADAAVKEATALQQTSLLGQPDALGLEALALVALQQGRPSEALAHAERALDRVRTGPSIPRGPLSLIRAEALHALNRVDEARVAIRAARDEVLRIAAGIADASLRESYLTRLVCNARTLELAETWLANEASVA